MMESGVMMSDQYKGKVEGYVVKVDENVWYVNFTEKRLDVSDDSEYMDYLDDADATLGENEVNSNLPELSEWMDDPFLQFYL